jgi:glycine cleavage system H protein
MSWEVAMNLEDIRYHKEHTWVRVEGKKGIIGITDHAQKALGDIVYIDLPEIESVAESNSEISEIESTKATSSVISPINGTVIEVNEELSETPEIINEDPYGKGWIAAIELSNESDLDSLMDASDYESYIKEES